MTRSLFAVFALGAVALTVALIDGCNNPQCGAGTKQRQRADGTLVCEPADSPMVLATCDNADGGTAVIISGRCVSRVQCDPATTMVGFLADGTEVCVSNGMGGGCPQCGTPDATHLCVQGDIYTFGTTNAGTKTGAVTDPIIVGAYDPLAFLADPTTAPLGTDNTNPGKNGCYKIDGISPPATQLLAIGVQDDANVPTANRKYMITGVGIAPVTGGKIYTRDAYIIPKTEVDMWSAQYGGGVNFTKDGVMVAQFFDAPPPDPTKILYSGMLKGAGSVTFGTTGAKYMMPRDTVLPSLTATAANVGVSVAPSPSLGNYTGTGGMCMGTQACKWQTLQAASTAGVVFVQDFFACNYNPAAAGCM
jgi:hypothetical protein